jgi:hypothetical protein
MKKKVNINLINKFKSNIFFEEKKEKELNYYMDYYEVKSTFETRKINMDDLISFFQKLSNLIGDEDKSFWKKNVKF